MRTGLTKRQKTTEIFFAETESRISVYTHNTDLKKRLIALHSEERRQAESKRAMRKEFQTSIIKHEYLQLSP